MNSRAVRASHAFRPTTRADEGGAFISPPSKAGAYFASSAEMPIKCPEGTRHRNSGFYFASAEMPSLYLPHILPTYASF